MPRLLMMIGAASLIAVPALAQNSADTPSKQVQKTNPSDRVICERQEVIGSRLGGNKVCKTAAQWQEERQQQRQTLESVQRQATSTGKPGG